jgi:hypothetical protein
MASNRLAEYDQQLADLTKSVLQAFPYHHCAIGSAIEFAQIITYFACNHPDYHEQLISLLKEMKGRTFDAHKFVEENTDTTFHELAYAYSRFWNDTKEC